MLQVFFKVLAVAYSSSWQPLVLCAVAYYMHWKETPYCTGDAGHNLPQPVLRISLQKSVSPPQCVRASSTPSASANEGFLSKQGADRTELWFGEPTKAVLPLELA